MRQPEIDFSKTRIFLCSPQSSLLTEILKSKLKGARIQTANLLLPDALNPDFPDEGVTHVHLQNIHCQKNQLAVIPLIQMLVDRNIAIIVSSGKSWEELFSSIKEIDDQVKYAETFAGFDFHTLPIRIRSIDATLNVKKNILLHQAENEEVMQSNIAQYADIWSELNFQEKLVCYSFSSERFLNKSRKQTINELIRKGILVKASPPIETGLQLTEYSLENEEIEIPILWQKYEFFSRLFQTYILTHISLEEIRTFREFESKNGNSRMIQVSALSFVLICFALISLFDRTFLNEIYAYLTGTLGILGSLYALLNRGFSGFKTGKIEQAS
ncbi:hypothetical protein [Algoriphagus sp. NG3]|uniref:hypothetical protein n=1 Tax=Algoriphagus sp. NG3 TaxID=3097546 RepID=UPI002A810201|nr:hypothetical protein [Algoriphagus sp. NG3]WPR75125.1 hypothetical protein SLW71_20900 [Algoriphagus sp. NG3]